MKGLLKLPELRDLVSKGAIETVVVGFTDHYGRLLGKRFDAEMFIESVVDEGSIFTLTLPSATNGNS